MRAPRGYLAGIGTTGALVAAIGCTFAVVSGVVAVHGWPGAQLGLESTTLDGGGSAVAGGAAPVAFTGLGGLFAAPAAATAGVRVSRDGARVVGLPAIPADGSGSVPLGDSLSGANGQIPAGRGTVGQPAAGAPAAPGGGTSAAVRDPAPAGSSTPPPGSSDAPASAPGTPQTPAPPPSQGSTSPGGAGQVVTQVTSGVAQVVTQTGQAAGGAVSGATGAVGGVVGQASPPVGQVVTQTGQAVGGVVGGATGAVGGVLQGAGTVVGGLLGSGR